MNGYEVPAETCEAWGKWIQEKWRELNANPDLHSIEQPDNLWVATCSDRRQDCPYCGHTLERPKSHRSGYAKV